MGRWSGNRARDRWTTLGRALGLGLVLLAWQPGIGAAVQIGGPFTLVDQHGVTRSDADLLGSYLLVYFGYTYCPDLCPTALLKMTDALDELAERSPLQAKRVVPLFISVDPERDTPEVLRAYAEQFSPRLVALTGSHRALGDVGRRYGMRYARAPGATGDDYLVDHTSFLYLMGPDGKYLAHFEKDVSVDDLVDALERTVTMPHAGSS